MTAIVQGVETDCSEPFWAATLVTLHETGQQPALVDFDGRIIVTTKALTDRIGPDTTMDAVVMTDVADHPIDLGGGRQVDVDVVFVSATPQAVRLVHDQLGVDSGD